MPRKRKIATVKPEPVPKVDKRVWGHDSVTHKRLFLLRGTPGFTPNK